MKFLYKFSNLLGAFYRKGNLLFTPDGDSVISAIGNRISVFNLRNNTTTTLPIESRFNYTALDLSPNGCVLLAINEEGEAHMISLISQTIIRRHRFKKKVRAVKFSPDGKHFAVCKENNVFVFQAPSLNTSFTFTMERVFHGANDETTCLDWSFDSKILAVGAKDMTVKLYPLDKWQNFRIFSLGNHTDVIVGCFFEADSYDVTTISRNGQACVWECSIDPNDLVPLKEAAPKKKKLKKPTSDDEDDYEVTENGDGLTEAFSKVSVEEAEQTQEVNKLFYKRLARHYLADEIRKTDRDAVLTAAAYHKRTKILVVGFSAGAFFIYELPDVNLIHSLSISDQRITSITMNSGGDSIALGCGGLGKLLVWEWQSERCRLEQQGHSMNMTCVCYSSDGQLLATGGEDGKVKLWDAQSGFCRKTFTEHSDAIKAIVYSNNRKFVVSASLDGTVRAFDILRYRNFRTFVSPRPVQFACVAIDSSDEFVAAGGQDVFEIFLWSVKTGSLLEILSGHEGPVSSLAFSPSPASTTLASVSWDKTLRIWEAIEKASAHETIEILADGLCVVFKPNGKEVAVATLNGQISVFDLKTARPVVTIEGRNDLGSGRSDTDHVTAKQVLQSKAFTSLCYSADGKYLLAGGQSKNVCIYYVKGALIVKRFEITQNRSLDAVDDFINRRKMTEFGNINLVEERDEKEGGDVAIKLPGVRSGDMASRALKPEVRVFCLRFSPTGQQWAAATTEGLLVYSLNPEFSFDPWDLDEDVTPSIIRERIKEGDYENALIKCMRLNEPSLIKETIQQVPVQDIELVISKLGERYVEKLLVIVASLLDTNVRHSEFYITWIKEIVTIHGQKLRGQKYLPALLTAEKVLLRWSDRLSKISHYSKYAMQFVLSMAESASKKSLKAEEEMMETTDDEADQDMEEALDE